MTAQRLRLDEGGMVDLHAGEVRRGDERVALTETETRLLGYLAARPDAPCSTRELLTEVWGYHEEVKSRAVDATVHRLRKKLELDPARPRHLVTIYGKGVVLRLADATPDPHANPAFVGRSEEAERAHAWLDAGRSVLLTGPGGIGKTRLARLLCGDGVFCSLQAARTVQEARRALAWTLGVDPARAEGIALASAAASCERLILDDVDAVDGVGPWIDDLVQAGARVIVTARQVVEADLECLRLAPLGPEAGAELLRELAGVPPSEATRRLVERVGGLPLALHLIHPHLSWLPVDQIAKRVEQLLDETADPDRRTVRTVLETSLQRLEPGTAGVLRRLTSLPHHPWPLVAAEAVAGGAEPLRRLVEASLLEEPTPPELCLTIHPLVHASTSTTPDDRSDAEERLIAWFVPWVEPILRDRASPSQVRTLLRVAPLLAALSDPPRQVVLGRALAAYERGDHAVAGTLAHAVPFDDGPISQRARILEAQVARRSGRAREAAESLIGDLAQNRWSPEMRSLAWHVVGTASSSVGDAEAAMEAFRRAAEDAEALTAQARAHLDLDRSKAEAALGELDRAYQRAQRAWSVLEQGPDDGAVNGLNTLGTLALRLHRVATAHAWFQLALDRAETMPPQRAVVLNNLAAVELGRGRADIAAQHARAAIDGHRRSGRRAGEALARLNLGRAALLLDAPHDAVLPLELAAGLAEDCGRSDLAAWCHGFSTIALAELGELDEARRRLSSAPADEVGRLARAYLASAAGEEVDVDPLRDITPELGAHVRALVERSPPSR